MNIIFAVCFTACAAALTFINPDGVLSSMLSGGQKALDLTLKMTVIYAVWLGVFELVERSGLSDKTARLLKPANRALFGKLPDKANEFISMNISANMLGMSGATTPMGIKAIQELEKHEGTENAIDTFFVINATSIQLIPTSVMSLRTAMHSASPSDIILPTILATALSSVIGLILIKTFPRRRRKK